MMTVGAQEARIRFAELLDLVAQGETVLIMRRGQPIARLTPFPLEDTAADIASVIKTMESFQKTNGPVLGKGVSVRQFLEEGRK